MKLKPHRIRLPITDANPNTPIEVENIQLPECEFQAYFHRARVHLEQLKRELYMLLDAGFTNANLFNVSSSNEIIFDEKISAFMEKAYTLQQYNEQGVAIDNRKHGQAYINAGTAFNQKDPKNLEPTEFFLLQASDMVNSINSALSQLNKTEVSYNKNKTNPAEEKEWKLHLPGTLMYIDKVIETADKTKMFEVAPNGGIIQTLLSELKTLLLPWRLKVIDLM